MIAINGAINEDSNIPVRLEEDDFGVTSAGYYKMLTQAAKMDVFRPNGRPDYQLLFVVHGSAFYTLRDVEYSVREGGIVLYRPNEMQKYTYRADLHTEVYWVHFSGRDPERYLHRFGLDQINPQYIFLQPEYMQMLDRMIEELQMKRPNYQEFATLTFLQLLVLISRHTAYRSGKVYTPEVEDAIRMFHTRFAQDISLSDYARQCNMSLCWFTRQFRSQTGKSPQQYLTDVRISRAKSLLDDLTVPISQVADMLGYQSPLYFSRVFKKHTGFSPSQYRKKGTGGGTETV